MYRIFPSSRFHITLQCTSFQSNFGGLDFLPSTLFLPTKYPILSLPALLLFISIMAIQFITFWSFCHAPDFIWREFPFLPTSSRKPKIKKQIISNRIPVFTLRFSFTIRVNRLNLGSNFFAQWKAKTPKCAVASYAHKNWSWDLRYRQ